MQIQGTETFRDSFLIKQIAPFYDDSPNVTKLLQNVDLVTSNLTKSGTVEDVAIQLDTKYHQRFPGDPHNLITVQPKLTLIPIKKFMAKTGTNVGNGEGDGYMSFQWRNIFGGGESLMFDATTGTRTRSSYLLNYSSPFFNNAGWKFDSSLFTTSRKIDWSSHEQVIKGLNTKLVSLNNVHMDKTYINHEISVESILRSITNVIETMASNNILFQAGDDFKTSLLYKFHYDSRDDRIMPTSGSSLLISNELSGLSRYNASKFIKQSIETTYATNIQEGAHFLNLSLKGGWLYSLNDRPTHIMDRFYLGGPNDVRSFYFNGLGPRNFNDTLGGDIYLSGGLSLFHKLPFISKESAFKIHEFINFGSLLPLEKDKSIQSTVKSLIEQPSVGAGFGLIFKHPVARFELNFVLPLSIHQNDSVRKGFQYGIGLTFL